MGRKMKYIHTTRKVNRTQLHNKYDSLTDNIEQKKHDTCIQYDSIYTKLKNLVNQNHII